MAAAEKLLEFQFPARSAYLCTLREKLREVLGPCSPSEELLNCVVLAVSEACVNIIEHAYCEDDTGDIILEIERQDDNIIFRLTDFAHRKTSKEEMKSRPLEEIRPGGLGCHIINEIMDEVQLIECNSDCGNVLQMKKKLEP
ncbi:MAG: ATP-binding protein [Gammaproteobacteria bacterium]|jgi:sigma-B regulation protein RsbU (phosphoserine phosphatase)|nr:ATP-binding protein [Gammaproteobacteria bacterium]MBT6043717.1 ATP-binding protein [Gammaproteobacteria bacterium]